MHFCCLLRLYRAAIACPVLLPLCLPGPLLEQMDVIEHHMGLADLLQVDETTHTYPRHEPVLPLILRDALVSTDKVLINSNTFVIKHGRQKPFPGRYVLSET